ncbi:unnamed protein product [Leptidea sinapis]|uniref:MADF domain-containing protein n=1 Tax=Leptidea sinapis TaxID=189913 RepID=A0A5E4Q9F7_9NEOP|nr:unnamed protein product [Leptidea sinapis]
MEKEIKPEELIPLVHERAVLWDKTLNDYKNNNLIPNFEKMEEKERQHFGKLVLTKWTNLRNVWIRTNKNDEKKSGPGAKSSKPYVYKEQMDFLRKVARPNPPQELLTLPSGWRVQFDKNVNFLFETDNLEHASPATVSRMGIILLSEEDSCCEEVLQKWVRTIDTENDAVKQAAPLLVDVIQRCMKWLAANISSLVAKVYQVSIVQQIITQIEYIFQEMSLHGHLSPEELIYTALQRIAIVMMNHDQLIKILLYKKASSIKMILICIYQRNVLRSVFLDKALNLLIPIPSEKVYFIEPGDEEILELVKFYLNENINSKLLKNDDLSKLAKNILSMFKEILEAFDDRIHYVWNTSHLRKMCENIKWYSPTSVEQVVADRYDDIARKYLNNDKQFYVPKLRGDTTGVYLEATDYAKWYQTVQTLINQAYIKQNLGIVICLEKNQEDLPALLGQYPFLYNSSDMIWLDQWSEETMREMPSTRHRLILPLDFRLMKDDVIDASQGLDSIPVEGFCSIYNSLEAEWLKSPRRYVQFIKSFYYIFTSKKSALVQRKEMLSSGVDALRLAREEVSKLQAQANEQEAVLSEKREKANKALQAIGATVIESLNSICRTNKTVSIGCLCSKKEIEAELASVEPVVAAARAAVGEIKPESLSEERLHTVGKEDFSHYNIVEPKMNVFKTPIILFLLKKKQFYF